MPSERYYIPYPVAFLSNGNPAPGSKSYFYLSGTTTLTPVYTDEAMTTTHPNPVVANAAGKIPTVWLNSAIVYRVVIKDKNGVTLNDEDPVVPGVTGIKGDPGGNVSNIGLFSAAPLLTIDAGTDAVRTSGYSQVGYGAAWYAYDAAVDAAYVTAHPRTAFVSANGRGFKLNEKVWDFEMFGAIPDNSTDCYAAWLAMKAEGIALRRNPALSAFDYGQFAPQPVRLSGEYYSSATWQIHLSWAFFSAVPAGMVGGNHRVRIRWPINTTMVVVNNERSNGDQVGADGSQYTAAGTSFEGISFVGGGGTDLTKPGFWARTRVQLRHCSIANTAGNALEVRGSVGATTTGTNLEYGNCNDSVFDTVEINNYRTGLHGVYVKGTDANACLFNKVEVLFADYSAIWDYSFLGNTWISPAVHDNGYAQKGVVSHGGKAYVLIWEEPGLGSSTTPGTDNTVWYDIGTAGSQPAWSGSNTYTPSLAVFLANPNNRSRMYNPYVEGQLPCHADVTAIVDSPNGGNWTRYSPINYTSSGFAGQIQCNTGFGFIRNFNGDLTGHALGAYFCSTIGNESQTGRAVVLKAESQSGSTFRINYALEFASLNWDNDTATEKVYFHGPLTTFTGGRSAAVTNGAIEFREFFLGAGSDARSFTTGTAAPASGYHALGEVVFNRTPVAGGPVKFVCTVAGTPGTWASVGIVGGIQGTAQADTAGGASLATLIADHNALLAKLRTAKLIAT